MKLTNYRIIASDIFSGLFILLFVYAAVSKLQDFQKFRIELGKSPLLAPFSGWIGPVVISLELLIAFALCIKKVQLKALYLSFGLMVLFTAYILVILNFSAYIPCSCGGILEKMGWKQHLQFNLLFVGLGAVAVLIYPDPNQKIIAQ